MIVCVHSVISVCFYSGKASTLPGLNAKRSVAVKFHCILPKILWEWDESSHIYMRFEGADLGNWEVDIGSFLELRSVTCLCEEVYMWALT